MLTSKSRLRCIRGIRKVIKNPAMIIVYMSEKRITRIIPDKLYIQLLYRGIMRKKLNLDNPKTYNEKLQWLKLYFYDEKCSMLVDKYEVRKYIDNVLGKDYLIPTYGVWNSFDEIDFNALPNEFVLKPTHTSGNIFICKDKSSINKEKLRKEVNLWLKRDYFWQHREWPYKNISHRIIADQLMIDESGYELKDYKFFCFNGEVKMLFIATDREIEGEETKFDFFDAEFNHLDFKNGHENSKKQLRRPESFEKMKEIASKLSKGFPHVRVDLYDINGKIYFGEFTFFHWSGLKPFEPEKWDYVIGDFIKLPDKI